MYAESDLLPQESRLVSIFQNARKLDQALLRATGRIDKFHPAYLRECKAHLKLGTDLASTVMVVRHFDVLSLRPAKI